MVYRTNNHTLPSSSAGTLLDVTIHFDDVRVSAPLAVCVHGFTNTMRTWNRFAHHMVHMHGYAVVCYTLRGHAGSAGFVELDNRGLCDVETVALGVVELYRGFVHPGGMLLVAYSLGGWFARRVVERSTLFDRLVLLAPLLHIDTLRVSDSAAESGIAGVLTLLGTTFASFGQSLMAYSMTGTYVSSTLRTLLRAPLGTCSYPVLYVVYGVDRVVSNADTILDFRQNTHPHSSLVVLPGKSHTGAIENLVPLVTRWLRRDDMPRWRLGTVRVTPTAVTRQKTCDIRLRPWDAPILLEVPLVGLVVPVPTIVLPWAFAGAIDIHTLRDNEQVLGPVHVVLDVLYDPAPVAHVHVYCLLRTRDGSSVLLGDGVLDPKYAGAASGSWTTHGMYLSVLYPVCPVGGVLYIAFNRVRFGTTVVYPPALSMEGALEAGVYIRSCVCTLDIGVAS